MIKTHYAGEIIFSGGIRLPGWAACCSGDKAVQIREQGSHSYDERDVTCNSCLKMIQKHKDFQRRRTTEARDK